MVMTGAHRTPWAPTRPRSPESDTYSGLLGVTQRKKPLDYDTCMVQYGQYVAIGCSLQSGVKSGKPRSCGLRLQSARVSFPAASDWLIWIEIRYPLRLA